MRGVLVLAVLAAGCHTTTRVTTARPGPSRHVVHDDQRRALAPTIALTDDGRLRFVAPVVCAADVLVELESYDTVRTEPNLATVIVGIVLAAAGGVTAVATDGPARWGGGAGGAVGAGLAVAPWFGNGVADTPGETRTVRKGAAEVACGEEAVVARTASVRSGRFQAFGAVAADGTCEVSPFAFVDAFAVGDVPAVDLTVDLIDDRGVRSIAQILDAAALRATRDGFLAAAGVDARAPALRKVPRLDLGAPRVSRASIDGRPHVRVELPLDNAGPGDAWQVRAIVAAEHAELDGRVAYVGHLPARTSRTVELLIPVSAAADAALADDDVELTVTLRDAHDTAPATPVRFRGRLLAEAPR